MRKYIVLTKVMLKGLDAKFALQKGKNGKRSIRQVLLMLLLLFAFLPLAASIGTVAAVAYDVLAKVHQEALVLGLGFAVVSMAVFFFGIFYIMSVFYFSKDIENLLPLPLKPAQILGAKFTVSLFYEYLTELLILLPIIIVYGVMSGSGALYYMFCLVVFLVLPIVPLVYAALINMIVMRFTNIARNKDAFRIIGGIAAMFFAIGLNLYIQKLSNSGMNEKMVQQLLNQGNNSMVSLISKLFPSNKLGIMALANSGSMEGIMNLLLFIGANILFILLFLVIGEMFYFKGVIGATQSSGNRRKLSKENYNKLAVQSSSLKAYVMKEVRLLFRTPIFFMNCVLMNFLWPVFLVLPLLAQRDSFGDIRALGRFVDTSGGLVLAGAFAAILFVTSASAITSTAISREGQNFFVCKYLPISPEKQINGKVLSGVVISLIAAVLLLVTAMAVLRIPLYFLFLTLVVSVISIFFCCYLGILIDLNFPKLQWDNEQKAVKQNLNVLVNMLLCIIAAAIPVIIALAFHLGVWKVFMFILIVFGIADAALYVTAMTWGVSLFEKIEG